ncbi:peptidyl-prolyl cis-trans isomerase FKBP3 [Piptocephalis cylindrospora]|uniref:peptidylprolyl isomerase n=1 Tax=Piptocephalis cylindrospora TaxID=1907219 RepID=A0A4P9Y213_9FUNG|nr:peptidyl-prolyl cis-trans isomerase FKBP3 [Piptocephalis cylindrospora]|eukprot:RKP12714.1 peptidyl-prolyl cis-trans isomerase FKBP3 [Piptocephalis cylindrospora]
MSSREQPWSDADLAGDAVSKKDLLTYLHTHASNAFLVEKKLNGKLATVAKNAKRPALISAYTDLFASGSFREEGEVPVEEMNKASDTKSATADSEADKDATSAETAVPETPKFKKVTLRKGDKVNFPKKGDTVSVWYTGCLSNGKVFDSLVESKKKKTRPLRFKIGAGKVIRGWDEGLRVMSVGEKAKLTIESDWAYGSKGLVEAGIGKNEPLIFEVELVSIQ